MFIYLSFLAHKMPKVILGKILHGNPAQPHMQDYLWMMIHGKRL